jgi:hypothetical protein
MALPGKSLRKRLAVRYKTRSKVPPERRGFALFGMELWPRGREQRERDI